MEEHRKETDLLGELEIPKTAIYGIQTYRAILNFPVKNEKTIGDYPIFISALIKLKKAAAIVNGQFGLIDKDIAEKIQAAADKILQEELYEGFPIHALHGGGGTSANMNANEVLANIAEELMGGRRGEYKFVHPNDHVNHSQSTNDIYPSACYVAIILKWKNLKKGYISLAEEFDKRGKDLGQIKHLTRTCLQDAVEINYQEFLSGYSSMIRRSVNRIDEAIRKLYNLNMGGTIVGRKADVNSIYLLHILPNIHTVFCDDNYQLTKNFFDAAQNTDDLANISNQLALLAQSLVKIAQDFRLLGSGPESGFNELILPPMQPGSSIMPGKVNPVIPEFLIQLCYKVIGNNHTVQLGATTGELDLNIWESVMTFSILDSLELLHTGIQTFKERCIQEFQVNIAENEKHVNSIIPILTRLMHQHGYSKISSVCKKAKGNTTLLRGLLKKEGYID